MTGPERFAIRDRAARCRRSTHGRPPRPLGTWARMRCTASSTRICPGLATGDAGEFVPLR